MDNIVKYHGCTQLSPQRLARDPVDGHPDAEEAFSECCRRPCLLCCAGMIKPATGNRLSLKLVKPKSAVETSVAVDLTSESPSPPAPNASVASTQSRVKALAAEMHTTGQEACN